MERVDDETANKKPNENCKGFRKESNKKIAKCKKANKKMRKGHKMQQEQYEMAKSPTRKSCSDLREICGLQLFPRESFGKSWERVGF